MEQSALSQIGLPVAVFAMMVTLGLAVDWADFKRVLLAPRAVAVGLGLQLLALPAVAFAIAFALPLDPVVAVSIILLASAPGGATSNVIVHVADGDRALSVTLTALSGSVSWLTVPLLLSWAVDTFEIGGGAVSVPFVRTMLEVAAITLVPLAVGMLMRWRRPGLADRTQRAGKVFSGVVLFAIVSALLVENWELVVDQGPEFAPALILLNATALSVGFWVGSWAGLPRLQAGTVAVEVGIQNAALAITVALVSLDSPPMSVIPALYGLWMLISGFTFALVLFHKERETAMAA